MKRLLIIAAAVLAIFFLVACGSTKLPIENTENKVPLAEPHANVAETIPQEGTFLWDNVTIYSDAIEPTGIQKAAVQFKNDLFFLSVQSEAYGIHFGLGGPHALVGEGDTGNYMLYGNALYYLDYEPERIRLMRYSTEAVEPTTLMVFPNNAELVSIKICDDKVYMVREREPEHEEPKYSLWRYDMRTRELTDYTGNPALDMTKWLLFEPVVGGFVYEAERGVGFIDERDGSTVIVDSRTLHSRFFESADGWVYWSPYNENEASDGSSILIMSYNAETGQMRELVFESRICEGAKTIEQERVPRVKNTMICVVENQMLFSVGMEQAYFVAPIDGSADPLRIGSRGEGKYLEFNTASYVEK